jgi:hypothetical protein
MVDMKMGRAAFFDPLTETSPVSFFPPLIISLSNAVPLFCQAAAYGSRIA